MLEGDADYTVSQPPLFALGPSLRFVPISFFCLGLGENMVSNVVPEFDDLVCPRLVANMVSLVLFDSLSHTQEKGYSDRMCRSEIANPVVLYLQLAPTKKVQQQLNANALIV